MHASDEASDLSNPCLVPAPRFPILFCAESNCRTRVSRNFPPTSDFFYSHFNLQNADFQISSWTSCGAVAVKTLMLCSRVFHVCLRLQRTSHFFDVSCFMQSIELGLLQTRFSVATQTLRVSTIATLL